MVYLMMTSVLAVVAILVWYIQGGVRHGVMRYHRAFTLQARQGLGEMFLFLDPGQVWFASLLLCGACAAVVYMLAGSLLFTGLIALIIFLAPPYTLAFFRRRRLAMLERQLPDFLLGLAGALRAGFGIQPALRHSADHAPDPLSQELALMLREQRMGVSFEQALMNFYVRVPLDSLSLIVSALNIAAHSGGSLAETLERISTTLRMRLHLMGRVRALTSQGRMQAWIMSILPPGLVLVLHSLDPDAMSRLWSTPAGWGIVLLVVMLEATGIFMIRRIVHINV